MGRISHFSASPEETKKIAKEFASSLLPGEVIFFYGELGAGKTTFIASLVEQLTGIDQATSPTFSYVHLYEGPIPVIHFDLYRLEGSRDFFSKGLDEAILPEGITCIEWSERLEGASFEKAWKVSIKHEEDGKRFVEIQNET